MRIGQDVGDRRDGVQLDGTDQLLVGRRDADHEDERRGHGEEAGDVNVLHL